MSSASVAATPQDDRPQGFLRPVDWIVAAVLSVMAAFACRPVWHDVWRSAIGNDESTHLWLTPVVIGIVLWYNRERLPGLRLSSRWPGMVILFVSLLASYLLQRQFATVGPLMDNVMSPIVKAMGFQGIRTDIRIQDILLRLFAVTAIWGAIASAIGWYAFRRILPAMVTLLVIVPTEIDQRSIGIRLQLASVFLLEQVYAAFGYTVERAGSVLVLNGHRVGVVEACNGMRMVFALLLVTWTFANSHPFRSAVKLALMATSPVIAILANITRLVPTVWLFGHTSAQTANGFHDISGWLVLVPALAILFGVVALLRWMGFRVNCLPARPQPEVGRQLSQPVAWSVAVAMLAAGIILSPVMVSAEVAEPYHAGIRKLMDQFPRQIGNWIGQNKELPSAELDRVAPNAILGREYENWKTGRRVGVYLIQSKDARDIVSHFPANCYPLTAGMKLEGTTDYEVRTSGGVVPFRDYTFSKGSSGLTSYMWVASVLIRPDGILSTEMRALTEIGVNYRKRPFGASQLQIMYLDAMDPAERRQIAEEWLEYLSPIMQALGKGMPRDP